jgi:catechol 2,3-dioxygenase-like lactoylglutathione lyase family enzyme
MLKQLTHVQVWVHDQDEALEFYTDKLGMELREDVTVPEMGNFRWLSVGLPGQEVSITLMAVPGPLSSTRTRASRSRHCSRRAPQAGSSSRPTAHRRPTRS